MGARVINSPRRTKIGQAFPVLHMRSLRKSAMFSEGQRTEGHFRYPGASNAITIIVDLRSEQDLKVLLKVGHADSATNMQVIGLTHQPTGFNGRLFDVTCVYRKLKLGRSGGEVVCRGKARFLRGCKSLPARVAPAGSNRSRREGDDLSEASGWKGSFSDSASVRAVT